MSISIPNFNMDPVACLQTLCSHPPSLDLLPYLGSNVASTIKEQENPNLALLYIKAAARHLPALADSQQAAAVSKSSKAASNGGAAGGGPALFLQHAAAASLTDNASNVQIEMIQSQNLHEISEALGYAAARCQPRSAIAETGILAALERLLPCKTCSENNRALIWPGPTLTPDGADYLQICLYAGQAAEAQRVVSDSWPRPSRGVAVLSVLRYFYLRGLVHMQCEDWEWAVRCFWTCLCIPAEVTSALTAAAWKKLVLLQSLSQSDRPQCDMTVLKTPKTTPICVAKFIAAATGSGNTSQSHHGGAPKSPVLDVLASVVAAPEEASSNTVIPSMMHMMEQKMADASLLATTPSLTASANNNQPKDPGLRPYSELVRAFCKVNRDGFAQVLKDNRNQFAKDGNLPLVQLVESELVKRQIYQWSRVFSVIPLGKLSEYIGMPIGDLQNLLASFAMATKWNIEVKDGDMVYFPKRDLAVSAEKRQKQAEDLAKLALMMQKLDVSIATSTKFLALIRRDASISAPEKGMGPRGVEDV